MMKLKMFLLLLMVMMIGTFASTVAVGLGVTLHIVVAAGSGGDVGGMEGSTDTASGPIANHRCHNVQLPDRSRRLLVVYRANAADDRGRDLRFGITFCSYDCTMLFLLLLLLLLLTVTLAITTGARASLGPGDQLPSLLMLLVVPLTFRGILWAEALRTLRVVTSRCRWWCTRCRSRRTAAA